MCSSSTSSTSISPSSTDFAFDSLYFISSQLWNDPEHSTISKRKHDKLGLAANDIKLRTPQLGIARSIHVRLGLSGLREGSAPTKGTLGSHRGAPSPSFCS